MSPSGARRLFGTDGVRGVANRELTVELAVRLGRAAAVRFRAATGMERPLFFLGRDPRLSGGMLGAALTAGLCAAGADVCDGGVLPTPAVALLVRQLGAQAGVVISASHNPMEDNGIKFFDGDGHKLDDAAERALETIILDETHPLPAPEGSAVGSCRWLADATDRYAALVRATLPAGTPLAGLKVVVDGANGAASAITPRLLRELGAEVVAVHCAPDGTNINAACGSLHLDALAAEVVRQGAAVGLAHDGDADRVLFVDERGQAVDGDRIMALLALHLKAQGALAGDTVVTTVMSNLGFENFLVAQGVNVVRTAVGDRYVLEEMRAHGYGLGGEQSGHIIFYAHNRTGDGVITALQVLHILARQEQPFSTLTGLFTVYPQQLVNIRVTEKVPFEDIHGLVPLQAKYERELRGKGRILLRYSGTEKLARVMVEAEQQADVNRVCDGLAAVIRKEIGA